MESCLILVITLVIVSLIIAFMVTKEGGIIACVCILEYGLVKILCARKNLIMAPNMDTRVTMVAIDTNNVLQ